MVDAVRISDLYPIDDGDLTLLDEIVINDIDPNDTERENIETKRTTVASLIDFITSQDLVFTGNITINGSVKPEPGEELDIIVNDLTVKGDLVLEPTVNIFGLYLNRHLSDVNVAYDSIKTDHSLFWDDQVSDKQGNQGSWVSKPGVVDAPMDGNEYVRKNGEWVSVVADEPPCDGGYYVRRCVNGVYYWEDISDILFPYSRITQEDEGLIYTEIGKVIVTEESFQTEGTPGPQGPQGPQGETGPEGPPGPEIETYSINFDPSP